MEVPHGASSTTAKVWRWPLKSEGRDNRATFGLSHHGSRGDDHAFALGAVLSRWRYRSSGIAQRTSAAFLAGVKRAKNTPAASAVYPLVYPLGTRRRQNPLKTGPLSPGSNGAGPYTDEKAPGRKAWGFFVVAGNQIFDGLHR